VSFFVCTLIEREGDSAGKALELKLGTLHWQYLIIGRRYLIGSR